MSLGTTKSSRIRICGIALLVSVLFMSLPFILTVILDQDYVGFSFIAWVGLFFSGTFLALLASQLVRIEAEGRTSGKLLGIEMPLEIRGITVLLLGYYVLLAFFYLATDLEGQLSAKSLEKKIGDLERDKVTQQNIIAAFNAIHGGKHVKDVQMLKLSYHCGDNEQFEKITEWNRYRSEIDVADTEARKSSDRPFPVGRNEYIYRVRYKDKGEDQDFSNSPIQVHAKLDGNGVLTAKIFVEGPSDYRTLWRFCGGPEEDIYAPDDDEEIENKADPTSGG